MKITVRQAPPRSVWALTQAGDGSTNCQLFARKIINPQTHEIFLLNTKCVLVFVADIYRNTGIQNRLVDDP